MILAAGEQVSQVGIEPTTRGLKVPCSATELLAQALPDSTSKCLHSPESPPFPIFCRVSLPISPLEERRAGDGQRAKDQHFYIHRVVYYHALDGEWKVEVLSDPETNRKEHRA